jgi:hypothetical protein
LTEIRNERRQGERERILADLNERKILNQTKRKRT